MKSFSKALKESILISYLPKGMQNMVKIQLEANLRIDEAYCKLVKKIGSYDANKLLIQFKNEAFAGKSVKSEYIINKLNKAYEKEKNKE